MGCDIHAYLEIKRFSYKDDDRENGIWVSADKWTVNPDRIIYPDENEREWEIERDDRIWKSRWYFLFAVLAGVRNAWSIEPISEPKGCPFDASPQVLREKEWDGSDGHSHSWLTMKEIVDWDGWDKVTEDGKTTREILQEFWDTSVDRMQGLLTSRVTPEDIRIVFWFDN